MFSGLTSASSNGSARQPTAQEIASHRSSSIEKHADPLASIGLPQAQQAPMGQGSSAQRGAPSMLSTPGTELRLVLL